MSKKLVIKKKPDLISTVPTANSYVGLSQLQLLEKVSLLHNQLLEINNYLVQLHRLAVYDYNYDDTDSVEISLPENNKGFLLDSIIKYRGEWNPDTNTPSLLAEDPLKIGWAYIANADGHMPSGSVEVKKGDFILYDSKGVLFNLSDWTNGRVSEQLSHYFRLEDIDVKVPSLDTLSDYLELADIGVKVPPLNKDGLIPNKFISRDITIEVATVKTIEEMLALPNIYIGDVVKVTDLNKAFQLRSVPSNDFSNWHSFIDEVLFRNFWTYETIDQFPEIGDVKNLYLATKYDAALEDEEEKLEDYNMLYRWNDEASAYVAVAGQGSGGGGGGGFVTLQLIPVPLNTPLNFSHALGTDLSVTVKFTHSELQFATLKILRGATEVEVRGVNLGENVIDLTPHIRAGSNSITLKVTDGERSRSISYNITGVAIALTSTFNDAVTYGANVDIPFRVQTEAQRKVYFTVDGVTETITNVQLNNIKSLTGLTHGVKEVEIQAAALIGEQEILSNKLRFNIIVSTKTFPALISSKFELTEVTRGSLISIDYIIYNPILEFNETVLKVDGAVVGTLTAGRQRQFWNLKNLEVGLRTLRIEAAGAFKEFQINILPLDIEFENIEDGFLKLYLTSAGKSNNDVDKLNWENSFGSPLTTNLSNFNFASNGWIDDSLVLNGNATISIPFKPFQNVIPQVGKTIELEFETTEGLSDEFIRCMHNNRGFIVYKDRAILRSSNTQVEVFFKENEKIKISFVINPVAGYTLTYVNGVMTGIDRMNTQTSFQQSTAQNIIVNDKAVDGKLYNVRVYDRALEQQEILQNYLYDMVSLEDKIVEYNFSDIFNQSGTPDIEKVKERIPVMTIRTYTSDEVGNRLPQTAEFRPYVSAYYEHPTNPDKNFSLPNVRIRTQGTSSLQYPVKNYRLYAGDLDLNPIAFNDKMHPAIRINLKADYMESSMSSDPVLTKLFNQMYKKPIPPKAIDGLSRTTIWSEGAIALFHDDGQTVRFEGIYNFNGDKGDNKEWGFYPELPFPESDMRRFEILFNAANHAVAFVRSPELTDGEFLKQIAEGFEIRYPDVYDDALNAAEVNDFETLEAMYGTLREFIEFLSDADLTTIEGIQAFRTEFEQRAELEYFIKFLLSIFIFGLVDNFGKDLLLNTWSNEGGLYPKFYVVAYDLDSGIGIDNQAFMTDSEGNLIFDYNIEMEDKHVFAQASSKLWDAIVAAYPNELKSTYAELRGSIYTWENIWKSFYTDHISKISKGMYNANAIAKYIETPGSDAWLWMLNGDRVNQMSRWIRNRLAYLDSKYDYNTDEKRITARFDIDDTEGFNIQVKTSLHQWVSGQLGNSKAGTMKTRTQLGEVATLNHTYTNGTKLPFVEFELFNGQYITELVNMKDLPLRTLQISQAEQLKILDLSKVSPSSQLQSVSFGDNFELVEVNLQNNSGLSGLLDLSGAIKLKKLDLRGTSITSVILPEGGVLEELYLPNTITALEIRNQSYLTQVDIAEGTEIEFLILENTLLDYKELLPYLSENGKVRILGIEMSAYGEDYLLSIQEDLTGIGGIDSNGNYTDKPFMQGIIKIQSTTNINPDLLNWFSFTLSDLKVEVNVILNGLQLTEHEDHFVLTKYTQDTTGLISLPTAKNANLNSMNNIIFGIEGWKPLTKIADRVFANKTFTSIKMPDQLEEIGAGAFQDTNQFVEILIPETVTTIGANAFIGNNDNLIILTTQDEKPTGWDVDWHSGNSTVIWGVRETPTVFTFNVKGGDAIGSISAKYLTSLPTPLKFGANSSGWLFKGQPVSFPIAPLKTDPQTLEIEVDEWIPWVYEARFILPDNTVHKTIYVTYGDTLGSEFILIDKGGANKPTYGSEIFKGWYAPSSGGTQLTSSYVINQNALEDGYIVEFYAQFLDTRGAIFTYNTTDDVYDVTKFSLTDTSMANGSINLYIPATFDDGINGERYVRNIKLTSSNSAYKKKLGSVVIEENTLTNRKIYNIDYFNYLTEIIIPYGFTYIEGDAFSGCRSLTSITIPDSVTSIGYSGTFQDCSSLTSITIPDSVKRIGDETFKGCSSLTSVTIPNSVTIIDSFAFQNCSSLTSITIPESITSIRGYAFSGCSSLTSVTLLGNNLIASMFNNGQFTNTQAVFNITSTQNAISLTYDNKGVMNLAQTELITYPSASGDFDWGSSIPNSVTSIGSFAFQDCSSLTSITIPNSITSIDDNAFIGCSSLTSVIIPNSITSIGSGIFSGCSSLTSITIPESVTSISGYAFSGCSSLTSVTIPNSVTSIDSFAFKDCSSLTSVKLLRTTPPSLAYTNAFSGNASGRTFYIPKGTYSAYSTATNWSTYASDMEEVTYL